MKQTLLIALLIIGFQARSQTKKPIDSFLGIKFGSSGAQVTAALKAKGAILDTKNSKSTLMFYDNLTLGGRKPSIFYVRYIDDKAYEAIFIFHQDLDSKVIEFYDALVEDITDVYGKGNSYKKFNSPFKEGDGYEMTAIKSGDADYSTFWIDGENGIKISIDSKPAVRVQYQDGSLMSTVISREKEKNKADF